MLESYPLKKARYVWWSQGLTQEIYLLDSPEPSKLLIFINESHVIDLALKRGWQVLLDENEKNMCVIPLKMYVCHPVQKKPHYLEPQKQYRLIQLIVTPPNYW